jgi:membrane protein involved in colicin uptake
MCDPVSAALAAVGALGLSQQRQQASQANDTAAQANEQALAQAKSTSEKAAADAKTQLDKTNADAKIAADKAALAQDEANNRANPKTADVAGMASANSQAAKGGVSGTMLTGPQGVDPKTLLLGKTTLLGG